jgi:hypothetical protein
MSAGETESVAPPDDVRFSAVMRSHAVLLAEWHPSPERYLMRRFALFAAVLALSACSSATDASSTLPLDYRDASPQQVTYFSAEGRDGAIVVRDSYVTGVCHRSETETATRSGSVVTLRIAHPPEIPSGQACLGLAKDGAYEATIRGLEPGTYRVRVEYEGDIRSYGGEAELSTTATVQ